MATKIFIKHGNTNTHELSLYPMGTVGVDKWKRVVWSIDPDANVDKFKIVKKDDSAEIFWDLDPPPSNHTKEGGGRVHGLARDNAVYEYSIHWRHKGQANHEPDHIFDPKITVNPSGFSPFKLLIAIVAIILGFFSLQLLRRKMNRK